MEHETQPPTPDPSAIPDGKGHQDQLGTFAVLAAMADAVYCVDTAGRITFVNAAFEAMTGYALADLLGTPSTQLYGPGAEAIVRERRRQIYHQAPVSPYLEMEVLRKDGERLPVELSISSLVIEGRITGRLVVMRDITARRQSEARRLQQRVDHAVALLDTLFTTASVGLGYWDRELRFVRLNERLAEMNGLPIEAHIGKTPTELFPGIENLEQIMTQWRQVIATGKPMLDIEVSGETPAMPGQRRYWLEHFFPVSIGRDVIGVGAVIQDITAQKQAEAALQQANQELEQRVAARTAELQQAHEALRNEIDERQRMQEALFQQEKLAALGTLLANVAHELNNPLAVASMQVDNLQEAWDAGAWTEDVTVLRQAIERCQSVIQSFLALVRQQAPTREAVALNAIIGDVLVLLRHPLEVDGITLSCYLDEHLPPIWADAHQLHHVIVNLITNAHHALQQSTPAPQLTLSTRVHTDSSQVILDVSDNGPGIPQDIQRRIFDPFFTTKPQGMGSGLGLPLCRNIVEGNGGAIHLISQPGQGATVRVTLPVAARAASSSEAPPASAAPSQTPRTTILLIDDEVSIQRALTRLLQRRGHEVTTATNGLEGLAALQDRAYEIILCDMRMPDLDGPGFYRALERDHPHLRSRVIFLTGDVLSPEAQAFFNQVDCPRLTKPLKIFDIEQLIEKMQAAS